MQNKKYFTKPLAGQLPHTFVTMPYTVLFLSLMFRVPMEKED